MDHRVVGIVGGGQLGRMLVEAASRMYIQTVILDAPDSPAKQINASSHVDGSFKDREAILNLASKCDIITTEIEHVDATVLAEIESNGFPVHPAPNTIRIIQDKYLQKEYLTKHGIPTIECIAVNSSRSDLEHAGEIFGYPFMLKSRTLAYDGRGNFVIKSISDIPRALETLSGPNLYCERWAKFTCELAVMVVRRLDNSVASYPVVETIQYNNICHTVYAPAQVPLAVHEAARQLAERSVKIFEGAGVFGVEMFLLPDNSVFVNEIAPRPHNSGHYTIEACCTSQFEAHLRAILGLPLPDDALRFKSCSITSIMLNIIGDKDPESYLKVCRKALHVPGATVHLYGKKLAYEGRKMGHVTITGDDTLECAKRLALITDVLRPSISHSSVQYRDPVVGIIMGSDSDLPKMNAAIDVLRQFDIPFEVRIISAHRTPQAMMEYATNAATKGLKIIIAGAGGAAHLPGMVAALTMLPVIGVPIKGRYLDGIDSLYSIVQMPKGVPVATMAIDNSMNAGLLAARILGSTMSEVRTKLKSYISDQESLVIEKDRNLCELGSTDYQRNFGLA